jgi:hypothetical protein
MWYTIGEYLRQEMKRITGYDCISNMCVCVCVCVCVVNKAMLEFQISQHIVVSS